jgi:hypothetical protein
VDGITPREVRSRLKLSDRQQAVLAGTILGDGCVAKHGRHHRLHIKHKEAHRALAEWKHGVFREFISMKPHVFDQCLNGRRYPCVQFATRTHPEFTEWHSRFYQGRRKIVPLNIASYLSPLAVAVWFMDDGAADYAGITFQTHSFSVEEVRLLADVLRTEFHLTVGLRANRGANILYVPSRSIQRFRGIVEPHLVSGFEYKLVPRRLRTP